MTAQSKLEEALEARQKLDNVIHQLRIEEEREKKSAAETKRAERLQEMKDLKPFARFTPYPKLNFRMSTRYPDRIKLVLDPDYYKQGIYTDGQSGSVIVALLKRLKMTHEMLSEDINQTVYDNLFALADAGHLPNPLPREHHISKD